MPRLLETRALCAVDFVSIEWHAEAKFLPITLESADGYSINLADEPAAAARRDELAAALAAQSAERGCASHYNHTIVDDEKYKRFRSFEGLE